MKPKVSIIIPCYNSEKYIIRCIESLLHQTIGLENLELIFVNDASTDSTLAILLDYEKMYSENIMIIDLPENCRQGGARNVGINYATCDYIGFVDSDDWIESDMYEKLYTKMCEYDCDVVSCRYFEYYTGKAIGTSEGDDYFVSISDSIEERRKFLRAGLGGAITSKLYRKSLIINNKIYFPEKLAYEDNYWTSIMKLYVKSFYMIEENLYHYCTNEESTTRKINAPHHLDRLTIELMKLDSYKEIGVFDTYYDEFEFEFLKMFYLNTLHILFTRFYPIPINVIFYIKDQVLELFPNYKNNLYFAEISSNELFGLLEIDISNISREKWEQFSELYQKSLT